MRTAIAPIVEGEAEIESVPVLLRRVLASLDVYDVDVAKPFRLPRNLVVKENELERAVRQVVRARRNVGCILVIYDSDDDCPAKLGSELLKRCKSETQLPVAVVLAKKELECWFLGAKDSLRGVRGIRDDATAPPDPEEIRGAKERPSKNMRNRRYLAVDDQPALAEKIDLELARERCPSFDRFIREARRLISELNSGKNNCKGEGNR